MSKMSSIIKGVPVDKTAALVVSTGTHFDSTKKIVQRHSETPPMQIKLSRYETDLTGLKFGYFTVIGKAKRGGQGCKKAMWIVRCNCGRYETRRKRSVLNPRNTHDRCELCREGVYLQHKDYYSRTGQNHPDRGKR